VLTLAALDEGGRIVHGFFTREGGVSQGRFASLNCGWGSGDDLDAVRENRTRAMARMGLGAEALATVYQVHSARVEVLDAAPLMDGRPEADAMVTTHPGLALGILTADCVPVLLADPTVPIIGAAHAGWKGARDGVVEATVAAMLGHGARIDRIRAGIGPAIRQKSYEVGPEFPALFAGAEQFFAPAPRQGRHLFDLPGYVRQRLAAFGIGTIEDVEADTLPDETRFFSYRRATHHDEREYGRLLSAIAIV